MRFSSRLSARFILACAAFVALSYAATATDTPKTLHAFNFSDGSSLYSSLARDAAGNLYGTTVDGGSHDAGVVYELSPLGGGEWRTTILYNFKGGTLDGAGSHATPVFDSAGNLYGATPSGGLNSHACGGGCGVVFRLSPPKNGGPWTETILHKFSGGADGGVSYAGVILDSAGNLYGATTTGGAGGAGTVYQLSPTSGSGWQEMVLYNFSGADGSTPYSTPVFDKAGNLYGTTYEGGSNNHGTVYEVSQESGVWTEQVLCSFKGGSDGDEPFAGVIFDQAGNIYGTTAEGGTANVGTAFKLTKSNGWKKTILHQFLGLNDGDGANPNGLIFDQHNNLYGSTVGGGKFNPGTIFRISHTSSGWREIILYSFTGGLDGAYPSAALTIDAAGHLFGTTLWGGPAGDTIGGVAFEFTP